MRLTSRRGRLGVMLVLPFAVVMLSLGWYTNYVQLSIARRVQYG